MIDLFYVVSLFEHSLKLELAIKELEEHKIPREAILAKQVNKVQKMGGYLDPYNEDGLNLFIVSVLGMLFMLLGSIYGFVLYIGPILCALIGLIIGAICGLAIDYFYKKGKRKDTLQKNIADVMLFVKCKENKVEMVEDILRKHHALGLVRM